MKAIIGLLLLLMLVVSAVDADDDWTQKTPSPKPLARLEHAMAYIGGDQVLLFGGYYWDGSDNFLNDTWVYDLNDDTWSQKTPSPKPLAREYHAMAYIGGDQVLLFGGWDGSSYKNDTWVYDLSDDDWTQKTPSPKPLARLEHAMAYIGGDQVLLFGGYYWDGSDNFLNDTWVYDLNDDTWSQDENGNQPSAREYHALSETSMDGSSYLVLFGGYDGSNNKDDTWTFGGGDYPLPVELSSFTATAGDGQVTLRWVTESEVGNVGFHIYRAFSEDGEYERLTAEVIQGAGTATSRREYTFTDIRLTNGVTYWYKIEDVAFDGTRTMHGPISAMAQAEEAANAQVLPADFGLSQNFPNPFNPTTEIRYQLPEASSVVLAIYDLLGQEVRVLVDGFVEPGYRSVVWDAKDVASGIYLVRMEAGEFVAVRKMVLIR